MPLVYQHTINSSTRAALWKIEEDEAFFLQRVPVKRDVSHPHKRLQHLAGRYLLTELFPGFPLHEIEIADTRKPFLPDEAYHFSLSHCGAYAAAIASTEQRVGIDIEVPTAKVFSIAHKFLSGEERELLNQTSLSSSQLLDYTTLFWCAKEALYKWYGNGQVDFRKHLHLLNMQGNEEEGSLQCCFQKGTPIPLTVTYRFLHELALCWVTS